MNRHLRSRDVRRATRRPRRRGIALVIMLVALILLGGFLVVSARLFVTVMRTSQAAGEAERDIAEFESAVRALRADVWGATSAAPDADGGALSLQSSDGAAVRWHTDEEGALVRTIDPAGDGGITAQRWQHLGGRLRFAAAGPAVTVTLTHAASTPRAGRGGGGDHGGELQLVSQVLLAREMTR